MTRQRAYGDCATAVLSMVSGQTYEDTYVEVVKIDPMWRGKHGLYNREVIAVAARLELRLVATRTFDLEHDEGVLRIRVNGPTSPIHADGHFVALQDGKIRCPKLGRCLPAREYLAHAHARACTLLQVAA